MYIEVKCIHQDMRINSSKVYCKYKFKRKYYNLQTVLIVAKCIVNSTGTKIDIEYEEGINSSKVYCKLLQIYSYKIHTLY